MKSTIFSVIPWSKSAFWISFLALVIVGAYYPVVVSEYGFTDDYIAVTYNKTVEPWDLNTRPTALGRPISSLFISSAFTLIDSIGELSYLRALSVGLLILSASTAFLLLRNLGITALPAALAAAAIALNPAAGVFAGWAITYSYPISILLSLLGGWLLIRAMQGSELRKLLGGMLCILLSLLMYQPTALACVVMFAVYYASTGKQQRSPAVLHWTAVLAFTAYTMVIYYILYMAYLPLQEDSGLINERGGIVSDIPAKLNYFIKGPLWESTIWWGHYAPRWLGWIIVAGVVACVVLFVRRLILEGGWLKGASLTVLFLLTLLLAASPVLVPEQDGHQIRVFYSLMSLIGAIPAIAVARLGGKQVHRLSVVLFIAGLAGLSHYFVRNGIVRPHSREVAVFRQYLHEQVKTPPHIAIFKHTLLGTERLTNLRKWHEYGGYSSWLPWVPHHLINILLWEQFPELTDDYTEAEIIQVYPWQIHHYPEGVLVLDANYIFKGRYSPRYRAYKGNMLKPLVSDRYEDPLFGTMETLNRFWFYSDTFGFLRKGEDNPVELLDYGTYSIVPTDSPKGDILMVAEDGTHLITSKDKFPEVYSESEDRWYTLPPSRMSKAAIRSGPTSLPPVH